MLYSWSLESIEDGINAAVAISSAEPRKGTAKFLLLRAPLEVWLYQMIEDVEVLLLSSTASSGVVGIGVAVWWPATRVSARMMKKKKKGAPGFPPRIYTATAVVDARGGQEWRPGRGSRRRGGELQGVQDEDEGEDVSLFLSGAKRYWAGLGQGLGMDHGLLLGCHGQVWSR
jgi:hypothetical protein